MSVTAARIPDYCKPCKSLHTGGVKDGTHDRWCCHFSRAASKAENHCRNMNARRLKD